MTKFAELNDFKFRDKFEGITDAQFAQAYQIINAQFSGVYTLWRLLPPKDAQAKRELCINYLIAWKLVDMYPDSAIDVAGTGAIPLSMKKVGPIALKYKDLVRQGDSGILDMLTSNEYGLNALAMIQSAPENYTVFA